MSIERPDFEQLVEADLTELVASQVPEGLRLEYKREMYGNADADKRELLKDVSAFANAFGGHLIVGIEEADGAASAVRGIAAPPADETTNRIEQLLRDGLEPRIPGIRVRAVTLANGSYCIVVRIPRSWTPPHRVVAQNANRFWIRNGAGAHEASMDELRALFTAAPLAQERITQFRDMRLAEIRAGRVGGRPLVAGGRFILHIVPLSMPLTGAEIDLARVRVNHRTFQPIGAAGMTSRFNFEGYLLERTGQDNHGYTQVFRSGALEATKAGLLQEWQERTIIAGGSLENDLFEVFPAYMNGLQDAGVQPPLMVMMSLEGARGAIYAVAEHRFGQWPAAFEHDLLNLPACLINSFDADGYQAALKPALDALWNAAGFAEDLYYDEHGHWTGAMRQNRR